MAAVRLVMVGKAALAAIGRVNVFLGLECFRVVGRGLLFFFGSQHRAIVSISFLFECHS